MRRSGCAWLLAALLLLALGAAAPTPVAAQGSDIDWGEDWEEQWEEPAPDVPGGEAGTEPDLDDRDPLEPINRKVFAFNQGVDWLIVSPLSEAYGFVMPDLAKRAVRRFFHNLNEPVVFVNDLFQLELVRAGTTLTRFTLNTTVGVVGFWDPATRLGFDPHRSDFGETLAHYGTPSGPYLVVPLLGPSTLRDAVGDAVDRLFTPQTYLLGLGPQALIYAGGGVSLREAFGDVLEEMERSSVDYYATVRTLYLVSREIQLRGEPLSDEEYEKVLAFGL